MTPYLGAGVCACACVVSGALLPTTGSRGCAATVLLFSSKRAYVRIHPLCRQRRVSVAAPLFPLVHTTQPREGPCEPEIDKDAGECIAWCVSNTGDIAQQKLKERDRKRKTDTCTRQQRDERESEVNDMEEWRERNNK